MALSRMRTWSRVVTFSPLNALRIVTSLTLWMFLNRLRMLSSTNIFFSLLIFPSILILVVWGDGIEPSLCCSFGLPSWVSSYASLPENPDTCPKEWRSVSFKLLRRYQRTLYRAVAFSVRFTDTRMKETRGTTIYPRSTPTVSLILYPYLCGQRWNRTTNRPRLLLYTLPIHVSPGHDKTAYFTIDCF